MRNFFLLLLLTFLCTCCRAQLTITANLALVTDQCTGFRPDPNDNCAAKARGDEKLIYAVGKDGDLLFTYELINNSGKIIRRVEVSDRRFGNFFPKQKVNVPHGATVSLHAIYAALTKPETINGQVSLKVQYANESTEEVTGTYTLKAITQPISNPISGSPTSTEKLLVYPNPATDRLTLHGFAGGEVSLIDMQGKILLTTTLPSSGSLDVSAFLPGIYLLRANGESIRWLKGL